MIQLNTGNVLLKPTQRRQITAWLKRVVKFGERLGDFTLNLFIQRQGHHCQVRAEVRSQHGSFTLHNRGSNWRDAMHKMVQMLSTRMHSQWVFRSAAQPIAVRG